MSQVETLLERLVGFPSVVGTPNGAIVDFVQDYLVDLGAKVHRLPGPEGDRDNLFASFGDPNLPGYVLSAHLDVVPAQEPNWRADPFVLRQDGERLIGRGTSDMKGFVATVLSGVAEIAGKSLSAPVHVALSYDEEAGCRGAPHMIKKLPELCATPLGCIVGEPTNLTPVLAHKGKAALRITAQGVSGHSARPDLGRNAIHSLTPVLAKAVAMAEALEEGPQDPRFAPPYGTLQIGTLTGGQAINIIPEMAEAQFEARAIAGQDPTVMLEALTQDLPEGLRAEWIARYPPLALPGDHALAKLAEDLTGRSSLGAVSFGTEAGLFQEAGIPAVVCGPGDISRAHKPEEFITKGELGASRAMVLDLIDQLSQ